MVRRLDGITEPAAVRAIIFDFNGVIADDEAPHFQCFRQALAAEGLALSKEDYYGLYEGMDERHCAAALLAVSGRNDSQQLQQILARKTALFREYEARQKPLLFPGVIEFVKRAASRYRLAVASGGRKEQIAYALEGTPIEQALSIIVSADDIAVGKPDPAIYRLALARINGAPSQSSRCPDPHIRPNQCLVIEDSLAGIQAALSAGMKVVALATTYEPARLTNAHLVLRSLEGVSPEQMESLFT
jgi:beta-phosphoglucomutase-like phosphatase (HAD superfamily)